MRQPWTRPATSLGPVTGGGSGGWVYELTNCSQICTQIDLHDFTYNGRDGATPWGGPTLDADGNLYGTAQVGGRVGRTVRTAAALYGRSRVWVLRAGSELNRKESYQQRASEILVPGRQISNERTQRRYNWR